MATGMTIRKIAVHTEEDWRAARRTGLGASEAPSILGHTPWAGPQTIWRRKLGLEPEPVETIAMRIGRQLEPVIAALYEEAHPARRVTNPAQGLFRSRDRAFLIATPDRFVECPERGPGVLELKTARVQGDWDTEPDLAAIGSFEPRFYEVERDEAFLAEYLPVAEAFWHCVLTKTEPRPTGADLPALKRLYPGIEPRTVALPPEAMQWHLNLAEAESEEKRWRLIKDDQTARLLAAMGEAERATIGAVQYRRQRVDVKAEVRPREAYSYVKLVRKVVNGGAQ
jgi:hypothetical protein